MSRARSCGSLIAACAAALVVSCNKTSADWADHKDPVGPIYIRYVCGAIDSIGLADSAGNPAWLVKKNKKEAIEWRVAGNVTITAIGPKSAEPLPIDPEAGTGGAPGKPYKATVSDSARSDKEYHYSISLSCRPTTGPDEQLVIDPEMIVRPGP